jgi:hypothetical protein
MKQQHRPNLKRRCHLSPSQFRKLFFAFRNDDKSVQWEQLERSFADRLDRSDRDSDSVASARAAKHRDLTGLSPWCACKATNNSPI